MAALTFMACLSPLNGRIGHPNFSLAMALGARNDGKSAAGRLTSRDIYQ
jgi:hypothetical protein